MNQGSDQTVLAYPSIKPFAVTRFRIKIVTSSLMRVAVGVTTNSQTLDNDFTLTSEGWGLSLNTSEFSHNCAIDKYGISFRQGDVVTFIVDRMHGTLRIIRE